jgi:hypothetical protein
VEAEEDEFNEHLDSTEIERAIFVIDERSKLINPGIVNDRILSETAEQSEDSDRNASNIENKSHKIERLMDAFKTLRFFNR